jgi:CDP-diacylglycerol--glycerol-3-phosphate 3-phosphatidyltransferase
MFFIFTGRQQLFSIFLAVSFFTDLIDGFLARRFKVTSIFGAKLDSIADDLTILSSIIAALVFKMSFLSENFFIVGLLLVLYIFQNAAALIKYHKITSFHTYSAKAAALFQGLFFILLFLLEKPIYPLFCAASVITMIDLLEESILVFILPKWKANVKGIYWLYRNQTIK